MIISLLLLTLLADLSGTWLGQIEVREGVKEDIAFRLEQNGPKLGGKLYGDFQSAPIISGTVAGDLVTFVVLRQEQNGNEINESRIRFTGRLVGTNLELTRERESSTRAGSGASVGFRNNPKISFRLQRLTIN
jgi:hypothetical protein